MSQINEKHAQQGTSRIYDPVRKKWVEATPEERVRQKLLTLMIEKLGYPIGCFAIEKKLSEVTSRRAVPNRRLDILCFETKSLTPLLLIECKGVPIHKKMLAQVMGYNAYIDAPLICLVNQEGIYLSLKGKELPGKGLPNYLDLIDACKT